MDSLKASDAAAGAVATQPRITLADIEGAIAERHDTTADDALQIVAVGQNERLRVLSICVLVMKNGHVCVGTSAPANTENFNRQLGDDLAYQDAIRQLWPLMGFALRDRLAAAEA